MDHSREAATRARAYQLWEESGRADGSKDKHWRQAEREIAGRGDVGADAAGEAAVAPPAAKRPQGEAARHSDGMSPHPSVLDPRPGR